MITYIIQSTLCLFLFLVVYKSWYEKESMFQFNRMYLLFSLPASFVIPMLEFSVPGPSESSPISGIDRLWENGPLPDTSHTITEVATNNFIPPHYLWILYLLVVTVLTIRFFKNLIHIYRIAKRCPHTTYENASLILVPEPILPFTFASMIFVSRADYQKGILEPEMLAHELAHVRQHHSLDLILIESLSVVFWFNPLLKAYKKAIQTNHEFLADASVNRQFKNVNAYQNLLLDKSGLKTNLSVTNQFKHSLTKLRLIMMYKQTPPATAGFKKLALIPMVMVMAVLFSNRSLAQKEEVSSSESSSLTVGQNTAADPLKEYLAMLENARMENSKSIDARKLNRKKLRELYDQMTEEQRKTAPFTFLVSATLPEKKSPTPEQFNEWLEPEMFGVWLDDQRIANEKLNEYKPGDIHLFYQSKLEKNAKNYGKHTYQLNAYTSKGYDNMIQRLKDAQ